MANVVKQVEFEKDYIVFSDGRIYSKLSNKFISQTWTRGGYLKTSIHSKTRSVHRIVMEAFNGKSKLHVDHIDGNRKNNNLDNLEYVTQKENNERASVRNGGNQGGKTTSKKVIRNGVIYNSISEMCRELGLKCQGNITKAIKKNYNVLGHKVSFYEEI